MVSRRKFSFDSAALVNRREFFLETSFGGRGLPFDSTALVCRRKHSPNSKAPISRRRFSIDSIASTINYP